MWKLWRAGKLLNIRKMWIFRKMQSLRSKRSIKTYNSIFLQTMKHRMINVKKLPYKFSKKILKIIVIGTSIFVLCFFCIVSSFQKINQILLKEQICNLWNKQIWVISFTEQGVENRIINRIISINDQKLKDKFGSMLLVFTPKNVDELCMGVQKIKKYHHSVLVDNQFLSKNIDSLLITEIIKKLYEVDGKENCVIINLNQLNNVQIDSINHVLKAETSAKCWEINKQLEQKGFKPLFLNLQENDTLYDAITDNLPLHDSQPIAKKLKNLTLVTPDGTKYQPSFDKQAYGRSPNLTSLFIGSNVFGIPVATCFKIQKKPLTPSKTKQYMIESNNLSQLVVKWRHLRESISAKEIKYKLKKLEQNKLLIQTSIPLDLHENLDLHEYIGKKITLGSAFDYLFSVNNIIVEKLILNPLTSLDFELENNVLKINHISNEQLGKLMSIISFDKGVLVWCRDKRQYKTEKQKVDLAETGIGFMNKIVEIHEVIDNNNIIGNYFRYEQYFKKNLFRKITSFFW